MLRAMGLVFGVVGRAPGQHDLCLLEGLSLDDRRLDDVPRPHPLIGVIRPHLGGVAERDVLDVNKDLVLALPAPHLMTGVAGVGENCPDCELVPREATAVPVPLRIVGGRAGDAVAGQALGDGVEAAPGGELGEDPLDHRGGFRVKIQPVRSLAVRRLGRVGVRSRVRDQVAVRRTAAEEPALVLGLGGHGGSLSGSARPCSSRRTHSSPGRELRLRGRSDRRPRAPTGARRSARRAGT